MPDLPIWPQCNIGCVFCSNPVEGYRGTTAKYGFDEIKRKLAEYKSGLKTFVKFDDVRDYFNLTGGEPTIHPDFLRIVALIRTEFPRNLIRLLTNGRMFCYPDFAGRACGIAGLPFEVCVPVFGRDAKTHEAISRAPGSFAETVEGLHNLFRRRKPGQRVEIRVILTRPQMRSLDGLLPFLLAEFPELDRVALLFQEIEGFAERHREALKLPMSECARGLDGHYDVLRRFKEVQLLHFPLCVLPTRLWPWVRNTLAPLKVAFLEGCRSRCLYRRQCVGVHRSYERLMGAEDIRPILEPRPVALSGDPYRPIAGLLPEGRVTCSRSGGS